ncbi:MAG: hypothetical protein HND52_03425 [Ignavibacteriae bacterium]|nr:hypothetical protein [Ignavibacteriota bacterium]NOG97005.1 hypothetical protein [Ignavibacteriota bacterium]
MKNQYSIFLLFLLIIIFSSITAAQINLDVTKFLEGSAIEDITGDGENIWAATNGSGVYRYNIKNNKWTNYSTSKNNLQNDFVYSIAANKQYVWAGSIDGLMILDKKRNRWMKRKFAKGGQLSNWIRSLSYDASSDLLWIGRFKYLTKYDIKKRKFIDYDLTTGGDEKTNTIKSIQVDGDSLVWFGTEAGLHKYDKFRDLDEKGAVEFYNNRLNFFRGEGDEVSISSILFEQNNVWIGLDEFVTQYNPNYNLGGLYKFDRRNEWKRFDTETGFAANGIYDIERTGNFLWVSLYQFGDKTKDQYGRGLALLNIITNEVKMIYDERIPNTINTLYFDGKNMWLGSSSGIIRIELINKLAQWQK